ncbi:chord-domain-containing protein [Pholiota conissans]|uniref:Chord-domain-containing protein n=1 Tax=Pholiota conissans TaxID=109636 RepID=A0A9P5Z9B1_9AGAR|nr:chord-domain-containing protein [Pholiota conissans]
MVRCLRKSCGAEYDEDDNTAMCSYHPGAPVFHEGLKSWSCCQDIYKPVLDFDEFMQIPGCTEIKGHTRDVPKPEPVPQVSPTQNVSQTVVDGKEVFQVGHAAPTTVATAAPPEPRAAPTPIALEVDDSNSPVIVGTQCRRKGCTTTFVSDEVNRQGDGEGTVCHYHPLPAIFREGSKGYLCCKRRVLEFDEFMKIEGCKTGRHCFVPAEEQVDCRVDHYQTPQQVHVSVFGKQADKERSFIKFENDRVIVDLFLPNQKRFSRTLDLFGPIEPENSTFKFFGTKVELQLQKADGRMWTVLEKTDRDLGNISLTFGVGGRTGTVGGKEIVLDEGNRSRNP